MSTISDELRAAAQNVYDKLASEAGTVTIFDQERLGDALRSQSAGVRVPADEVFEMVRAAYVRGTEWMTENPGQYSYIAKAAYDYADKTTSSLALEPQQEEAVAFIDPSDLDRLKSGESIVFYAQDREKIGIPLYAGAHPTPAQKVQESQTVGEGQE